MPSILPFGDNDAAATIDIGSQIHFGATLIDVDCSADWSSQGGRLNMRLVEDIGQKFSVPVISTPYQFALTGISTTFFTYAGIVQSVERNSSNSKLYTVSLESPLKILDSCAVILDGFTGRGSGIEANANLVYGAIQFGHKNTDFTSWNLNYNVVNVFGAFENNDSNYGNLFGGSYRHGFGSATVNPNGIPVTKLAYAIDKLVNRASGNQVYLGANILYGTNSYNIGAGTGLPYYYFFDVLDFFNQVSPFLTADYRVGQGSLSLSVLDIVSQVCDDANMEFIVDLDYAQDTLTTPGTNSYGFAGSQFGGTIKIRTYNKNAYTDINKPFSTIAYNLLPLERPDVNTYGTDSGLHPGVYSGGSSTYQDPLDDDYTNMGTNSPTPYGGQFPVVPTSAFTLSGIKPENVNLSVAATDGTTSKFVVGGYQSRIVQVPRSKIMSYWGDITIINQANMISGAVNSEMEDFSTRKIPVITPLLHPCDTEDFILIDMQSIFGTSTLSYVCTKGIYAASLFEIRLAMKSYEGWYDFIREFKPFKYYSLEDRFNPRPNASVERALNTFKQDGSIGYAGLCRMLGVGDGFTNADTRVKTQSKVNSSGLFTDSSGSGLYILEDKIIPAIYNIVADIGNTHYGKSWYVPIPVPSTKLADNDVNLVGDFVRSWDISEDAYLEPGDYYASRAPQSSLFVKNGKVSAFVNYNHSFLLSVGVSGIFEDTYSNEIASPIGNSLNVYNFSDYDSNSLAYTRYPSGTILHAPPNSVGDYEFVPYTYFSTYNRGLIPFTDIRSKTTKVYNITIDSSRLPAGYNPNNPTSFSGTIVESMVNKLGMRSAISGAINSIAALTFNDHGIQHYPFVKVVTGRVELPIYQNDGTSLGHIPPKEIMAAYLESGFNKNTMDTSINALHNMFELAPVYVAPESITIPQRSNRYVYGPWITNIGAARVFAGKVNFEKDESLVPENYVIPVYGNYGSTYNYYSGMSGVNIAGQAIANAIDDFSLFAEEQGSITIPGYPLISRIGDSLYGIQNVTDINIQFSVDSVKTTYNFRTYSPRIGRTNRELVKKLNKISNTITRLDPKR